MSVPVVAFFNNKGGVGKTSLLYHVAWMFAELGIRTVAADADPQGNLTSALLDDDRVEALTANADRRKTVFGALALLEESIGDVSDPYVAPITTNLGLVPGDMALSTFEDDLSEVWPKCLSGDPRAFRVTSALWRVFQRGAEARAAQVVLVDLGTNLGALNRSALVGADYVVVPLGPDLFSLQGLRNIGPALADWREGWQERLGKKKSLNLPLPAGQIKPIGYAVLRHAIRLDRPVKAFDRWMAKIPDTYAHWVEQKVDAAGLTVDTDPACIAKLKDFRSLMPLAQEARKPMFSLKPADGALGAHGAAVTDAYFQFRKVATTIAERIGLRVPSDVAWFAA